MKWLNQVRFLLRPFLGRRRVHRELEEEFRFHLEMETEKLVAQGLDPGEARRQARLRFGGTEGLKEEVREVDGVGWMERLLTDGRFGLRVLRKNPVFAGVAILTLALGIGASTAIFSLVDGILLKPLPFQEPRELVSVWADLTQIDGPAQEWLSFPNYRDARDSGIFAGLGAYTEWQGTLTGDGPPRTLQGITLTQGTISGVLREEPLLGRGLAPDDDVDGAPRVILISHGLWTRMFGQDPEVLGRVLTIDGMPHEIVGVMGPGFYVPNLGGAFSVLVGEQEVWLPIQSQGNQRLGGRGSALFRALGRLEEGISEEVARDRLRQLGTRLAQEYPEANTGVNYTLIPLHRNMVEAQERGLWVLFGAVGFTLLLVCLNLANLVLARGASRAEEMALRSALGAPRRRLIHQLVTESLVMALLGGALGLGLAYLGTDLLVSLAPQGTPRLDTVGVDRRILLFTGMVTLGSGILFGLFPALRVSRVDLRQDLTQGTRTTGSRGGTRLRSAMVGGQMATALVLLVGAGLLLRTFRELTRVELGYEPEGVVATLLSMNGERYPEAADRNAFVNELEARVGALPGVRAVGMVTTLPLSGFNGDVGFQVEDRAPPPPGQEDISWIRRITPGYLEAMGLRVLEGRGFTPADDWDQDARVVMVNETLAQRYFPGESAVGKRLNFNDPQDPVWREIVGVVANLKNFGIREGSPNATYFPYAQVPSTALFLTVRTELEDPASLVPVLREVVGEMDSQMALARPATMEEMVSGALAQERFVATLLTLFSAVALILASVGLYGVVAYNVNRRRREIGLRMALGADGAGIGRLILGGSLRVILGGAVGGLLGALALTRLMEGLLFGVGANDPLTLVATVLVLLGVSALASGVPAWRASRLDPARTLGSE